MFKSFFHYVGTRLLATILSIIMAAFYGAMVHGIFVIIPGLSSSSFAKIIIVIDGITTVLVGFLFFYMQDKELTKKEQLMETNKKDVQ